MRRSTGGFSMVELITTISVIALIAGLSLSGMGRARQAASHARCISNLRQLGVASQLYWDDHAGRAFMERRERRGDGWVYWFGWLQDGAEGQRDFHADAGALWPYLKGRGVEACPSLNRASPFFKPKARGLAHGYGYNLLMGPRGGAPVNLSHVAAPAGLAVLADSGQVNDFQAPATPDHPLLEEFYYFGTNAMEATVHFRHARRASAVFADGHVAMEHPEPGSEDSRLAPHLTGRLSAERVRP